MTLEKDTETLDLQSSSNFINFSKQVTYFISASFKYLILSNM